MGSLLPYGIAQTINCAGYACFLALEQVQALNHPDVWLLIFDDLSVAKRSESVRDTSVRILVVGLPGVHKAATGATSRSRDGTPLHWRETFKCPTEEQYNDAVVKSEFLSFSAA